MGSGEGKEVPRVDGNFVHSPYHVNGTFLEGFKFTVIGNYNRVCGSCCKVYGHYNILEGSFCT